MLKSQSAIYFGEVCCGGRNTEYL